MINRYKNQYTKLNCIIINQQKKQVQLRKIMFRISTKYKCIEDINIYTQTHIWIYIYIYTMYYLNTLKKT